jgi:hypothetical protein
MADENILKQAYTALAAKQGKYDRLWSYYDGDQPIRYSAQRLQEVFRHLDAKFVQNWCSVVVDATLERIELLDIDVAGDKTATETINALWQTTGMALDDNDVHLAALVAGEAFVIIWKDKDGEVEAYYNDPRLCHVEYDPENPREKAWAAKWWNVGKEKRLTIYFADHIEYYSAQMKGGVISSAGAFKPVEELPTSANPFGVIPIFHFRRTGRAINGELTSILPVQDAINKLFADMMVAAEFGSMKQRWIISNAADLSAIKSAPYDAWSLPAGDGAGQGTQVGEFSSAELSNFLTAMANLSTSIAVQARVPKHYLFAQGGDPSGEALIALEAPLNRKCAAYIERFTSEWEKVAQFMLELSGIAADVADIYVRFAEPETVQPRTEAEIRKMSVEAGIPLRTQLGREGWSDEEIKAMEKDGAAAKSAAQAGLAKALLDQQRAFDQEGNQNQAAVVPQAGAASTSQLVGGGNGGN